MYTVQGSRKTCGLKDLDLLTVGLVNDMYIERDNDTEDYAQVATQKDYDLF